MQVPDIENHPQASGLTDLQNLHFAIHAAGIGIWELKFAQPWTIVWDERSRELCGLPLHGVISYEDTLQSIHEEDREHIDAAIKKAIGAGANGHYEVTFRTIGNPAKMRWVQSTGKVAFDDQGLPQRFTGILMDVTDKMLASQKAATAENLMNAATKGTGIGLFHINPRNDDIEYSPSFSLILTGENNPHLTRADFIKHIHPDDLQIRAEAYKNIHKSGELYYESRTIWTDGSIHWIRNVGSVIYDEDGQPSYYSGTVQDITEQKEKEQALSVAKDQFRYIVEQAPVAIGLLSGSEMVIEQANEAILKLWGKDAGIIGKPIIEALPELEGQEFVALLNQVYHTGVPFYGTNTLARLVHNDVLKDYYFDFVYTPIRDSDDRINGVMVLATDVSAQVAARKAVEESELRFRTLVEEATVATCLFVGRDLKIELANDLMIDVWGKDKSIIGKPLALAVPELEGQPFLELLDQVFTTGIAYTAENAPAQLEVNGVLSTFYFDFTYKPIRNAAGEIYGIMNMAVEVTEQVLARKRLEESELFVRNVIYNSPVAKMVFLGKDMIINMVNENMLDLIGRKLEEVVGLPLMQALPELVPTPIHDRLMHVLSTGETYHQPEEMVKLMRHGKPHYGYYNYIYKALTNTDGEYYGIIATATDVTEQVMARIALEASKNHLKSLVESAPFPIGVYTGREMRIELANQSILDVWGKGNDVIGKRYADILPELANQEIFQQLDGVYTTGIPFRNRHQHLELEVDGRMKSFYFNYDFTPLFDEYGKVYGVMNTAADVTDLVSAKQQVEETEMYLRGAIELAELGTWTLDVKERMLTYSPRLSAWFGTEEGVDITVEQAYRSVREGDRPLVKAAMQVALAPGSAGIYDVEYTVIDAVTGRERILHAQGKASFDEHGEPYKVTGTAQDVTAQRQLQLALEQEVQERTEELQAVNEELQAVNEELTATNEELNESNDRLLHSNEELAQYAYVASHDLQEPLRKIRMFSGMLGGKANLPDDHRVLISKISQSSERMTLLIRDLLEFSRLLKSDMAMKPVNIADIIQAVADDFELTIIETQAKIDIGEMPVIEAVSLQMNQLFYNLLSNALKFTSPHVKPLIQVRCEPIALVEAEQYVLKPLRGSNYFKIAFSDNGIGFETKYSEQIFEVFKRLHGKDLYPGSGIGLALCRRIVTNHNGALYTESEPGKGTTFYIILPDKRL